MIAMESGPLEQLSATTAQAKAHRLTDCRLIRSSHQSERISNRFV
jgi:hypothetical protein